MGDPRNLTPLTLLLRLFRELSDEPLTETEAEFRTEVAVRWAMWREQEGWTLRCPCLHGRFELHLREDVLGVRFFRDADDAVTIRLRILLNGDGLENSIIEFADDPAAKLVAARLLEVVSYEGWLQPLERSMAAGLQRFLPALPASELVTPQPPAPAVVKVCPCCGRSFTAEDWAALPLCGQMPEDRLELRNCLCRSTIAMEVA